MRVPTLVVIALLMSACNLMRDGGSSMIAPSPILSPSQGPAPGMVSAVAANVINGTWIGTTHSNATNGNHGTVVVVFSVGNSGGNDPTPPPPGNDGCTGNTQNGNCGNGNGNGGGNGTPNEGGGNGPGGNGNGNGGGNNGGGNPGGGHHISDGSVPVTADIKWTSTKYPGQQVDVHGTATGTLEQLNIVSDDSRQQKVCSFQAFGAVNDAGTVYSGTYKVLNSDDPQCPKGEGTFSVNKQQ